MQKGYRRETARATVARCRELGYVGDERFAFERARGLRARGAGWVRIVADLTARGLPEELAERAAEASREGEREIDWARRAAPHLPLSDPRARGRVWRLLAGRGFPEDIIASLLGTDDL